MEMTKYECERGHYFDVPCVDSLSGTPHYTCPKCGSEECRRVVFPGLIDLGSRVFAIDWLKL